MKPKFHHIRSFVIASSALLCISSANAQSTLTWDAGGGGGAITNGAGAWLGADRWNNGGVAATWTSGDDAIFAGPATAGGAVTLASPTTVNSLTFNSAYTGTYTLGTAGQAITLNAGITKNASSGAVTLASPITLGGAQTWTNNSATTLQVNTPGVTNAGHELTIDGTGTTSFGVINNNAVTLAGSGNLVKNGSGRFSFAGNNTGFSGNVTLNGGVTIVTGVGSIGSGNLTLNGGIYEEYWTNTFIRSLGAGAGAVQLTGGASGFSENGSTGMTVKLGNATTTVVWGASGEGAATGFFNPSTFVLQAASAQSGSTLNFQNGIDLNGATRTISVLKNSNLASGATISGAIIGTGASDLIKEGVGHLTLSNTNTYAGNTAVNDGTLLANTSGALPGFATAGRVSVAANATLAVRTAGWTAANIDSLRGAATWSTTNSQLGFDTSGGNFTYASNITEALSVAKLGTNTLILTGNNTYTGTTRINSATLQAGSATALGSGGDITFGGGTLQYTAASASTDFGSRIKNSGSAITIDTNSQNVGMSGIGNTNTAGLTKNGAGILTLSAANYSGGTTVNTGTLRFTGTNTYSGATTLNGGTFAVYDGTLTTSSAVTMISNTTISVLGGTGVSSTWNLGGQQLGTPSNQYTNLQIVIDGDGVAGSALMTNVGTLVWGRTTNNSTILLTDGGQMNVNGEIRIGNPYYNENGGANVTIGGGTATSTFTGNTGQDFYIGYGERTGSKNNVVTVSSGGVLTGIRDMFVGHVFDAQNNSNPSTNNQLLVTGTGTASMRGISLGYANATSSRTANANIVSVTGGGTLTSTGAVLIGRANLAGSQSNSNTMTVSGTGSTWNAGNQNVTVGSTNNATATSNNNILTVGADAVVSNVATLTVGSGAGTETGNQLVVNGSLTATSVSISANNSLSGIGTITGPVTVNGTLTPGNAGIGTLNAGGNLSFGSTGINSVEVDGTLATSDQTSVTGTVTINAATTLVPTVTGTLVGGQKYFIVVNDAVDAVTGTFAGFAQDGLVGTYGGVDLKISYVGDSVGNTITGGNDIVLYVESVGDVTPPTLTSITDNVSGGPVNIGDTVTYTVTFSEDMDAASVSAVDFANNGTAGVTVGTVTEGAPGVFSVPVTTTSPGTLVLRINALAVLEDVAGNDLNTTTALLDDTTITVRNAYQTWALANAISSAPGADKDGDGVNNAIEFLLGGDVSTNDLSKLPEVTTTATDMIFTFERKRSSIDGITGLEIEVGTTLTGWPTSYTVGTTTANSDSGVTVEDNPNVGFEGFDTITLTVPIGSDPKKFARLKANVTESQGE